MWWSYGVLKRLVYSLVFPESRWAVDSTIGNRIVRKVLDGGLVAVVLVGKVPKLGEQNRPALFAAVLWIRDGIIAGREGRVRKQAMQLD